MSNFFIWAGFLLFIFFFFFFMALYLLMTGQVFLYEYELFSVSGSGGFILLFDWVGVVFLSVVLLISFFVFVYSHSYMMGDGSEVRFFSLVLLFILSMALLVLSPNLMSLLLGWDGLGLISYALVIYYQNIRSFNAGMLTVLSNRVGDVGILLGILAMVNLGGWDFIFFNSLNLDLLSVWLFSCIFLAAMTKSAQIPFSSWLPAAMAAPTPVSSLVHSSTLVTAGVFLLIRFHDLFLFSVYGSVMMYISLLTLLMSGVGACMEMDFKSVIALSTLSQLALMMFSLSLGLWEWAYFHMLTHAIFKALLFLCAGSMIHGGNGLQDIRMLGGLLNFSPMVGYGMLLSFLSLGGIPFSCGFYSKDLIIELFLMEGCGLLYIFIFFLGVFSTIVYSSRLIYNLLLNGYMGVNFFNYSESKEMNFSIFFLSVLGVIFGGVMSWLLFDYSALVVLSLGEKMFTLIGVFLIFWFWLPISEMFMNFYSSIIFYFFISMWFLLSLASFFMSKFFKLNSVSFVKGDLGWGEIFGGSGVEKFLCLWGGVFQRMYYNTLFVQILLLLLGLIFLIK
uniref:NADH-ubiquinone oxidoreductase chain 5 n=1 Tax=Phalangium opilio TaxID=118624 RepID=B2CKZ0_PHAOP|nr:NADH dehydrogenase subunit 5 [Phalangium opilio]ACA66085.1 NADH dehydrogenase subunit 5 [Phalangium opilio]